MSGRKSGARKTRTTSSSKRSKPRTSMIFLIHKSGSPMNHAYAPRSISISSQPSSSLHKQLHMLSLAESDYHFWNTSIVVESSLSRNPDMLWQPGSPAPTSYGEHEPSRTNSS